MVLNASNLDTGESGDAISSDTCESSGDCVVLALDGKAAIDAGGGDA